MRDPDGWLRGEVILIDRFGNAVTNLLGVHTGQVRIGNRQIPVGRTYADVPLGNLVALVGSSGLVEIVVRDGNAAVLLGLTRGAPVFARQVDSDAIKEKH